MKDQFKDLLIAGGQIFHPWHPGLDLVVHPESSFLGIPGDQEVTVIDKNDIPVINGGEVGGVKKNTGSPAHAPGDPVLTKTLPDQRRQ